VAKQSPLSIFHQSNSAVFAEREGWLLPIHFGNATAEYRAVRSAAGLFDRCHRGLLQVTGPDRFSFLQGMLSNDLRDLKPGQGQYATVLNQQGKVLSDVRVLQSENSFYLDLWAAVKDNIVAHLNRYLIADEVEITDKSEGYGILSIQGPRSIELLQELVTQGELPEQRAHHTIVDVEGVKICVVHASHTGEAGFDLIIPVQALRDIAQRATDLGQPFSAVWVGEEAQNTLRVEAGIPRYGVDITEDNLLLETGLEHAVSFKKGCYLGQEVVERIRSRGHVNKKLCGLLLDAQGPVRTGDPISAGGRNIGSVTSSVYSPALARPIGLGYLHRDFWALGTIVSLNRESESITAVVAELPFLPIKRESLPSS
jgi:glycine cleavage system T protein